MKKYGASGWVSLGTAVAITSGTPAQIHASNTVASLMAANEEDYPFISFRVDVNSGQTTDGKPLRFLHAVPMARRRRPRRTAHFAKRSWQ